MRAPRADLPQLPLGFSDQLSFCAYILPEFATEAHTPIALRRVMFVSNGWKLSHSGRDMLRSKWQGYDSVNDANTVSTGKILINMDLCCASPWCWRGKCITVWDPTLHFELQMVNGNLSEFVDFKSPRGM